MAAQEAAAGLTLNPFPPTNEKAGNTWCYRLFYALPSR
jgi:hypothetical protein